MNQKYVIIVTLPELECYGTFKSFCLAKGFSYQTLANSKQTPKIGEPLIIGGYTVNKVQVHK